MQQFRGGLVFEAHRLCVSLNSRLESNTEEEGEGVVPAEMELCADSSIQMHSIFKILFRQMWLSVDFTQAELDRALIT